MKDIPATIKNARPNTAQEPRVSLRLTMLGLPGYRRLSGREIIAKGDQAWVNPRGKDFSRMIRVRE